MHGCDALHYIMTHDTNTYQLDFEMTKKVFYSLARKICGLEIGVKLKIIDCEVKSWKHLFLMKKKSIYLLFFSQSIEKCFSRMPNNYFTFGLTCIVHRPN